MLMNDDPILGSRNILQESLGYKERLENTPMNEIIQNAMNFTTYRKSIAQPDLELKPDRIASLLLEKSNPRLYLDETLNYGELKTVDQFGEKKRFFFVLTNVQAYMYDRKIRPGEFTTLDEALGSRSDDIRNYKVAFFSESSEFFESVKETRAKLVNDAFDFLIIIICIISILSFTLFLFAMKRT